MARRALVAAWEEMGRPLVPLCPGVYVRDLERWLGSAFAPDSKDIELARRTLDRWRDSWDYLLGRESLAAFLDKIRGGLYGP
jgi:hypothetical protein